MVLDGVSRGCSREAPIPWFSDAFQRFLASILFAFRRKVFHSHGALHLLAAFARGTLSRMDGGHILVFSWQGSFEALWDPFLSFFSLFGVCLVFLVSLDR